MFHNTIDKYLVVGCCTGSSTLEYIYLTDNGFILTSVDVNSFNVDRKYVGKRGAYTSHNCFYLSDTDEDVNEKFITL